MQLEDLIKDLKIEQHMTALSDWRDELLREKAEELQVVQRAVADKDTALSEAKAKAQADLDAKAAKEAAHLADVKAAILDPSKNPVETVAAIETLVAERERPERDKKVAALDAEIAAKQAERAALLEKQDTGKKGK